MTERYLHVEHSAAEGPCETHDWPDDAYLPIRLIAALQRPGGIHACPWCVDRAIERCNALIANKTDHDNAREPETEPS